MIVGIFFLCCMDSVVKILSERYAILQLVWIRFTGQMVVVLVIVFPHIRNAVRTQHIGLQVLRSVLSFTGTIAFFIGFSNIDLAAAAAILQVSPLMIVVLAYLVLGERFGWRRLIAVCVGLAGSLIIIRPGTSMFSVYALFPLLAAAGFSGFAVATRFLSRVEGVWTSFFYVTFISAIISSAVVPFYWTTPAVEDLWLMILVGLFASAGQFFLIKSLFTANASTVAPFGYSALVFSAIFGMILFAEFPDMWTYIGAVVVAAAGVFVWYRELVTKEATG